HRQFLTLAEQANQQIRLAQAQPSVEYWHQAIAANQVVMALFRAVPKEMTLASAGSAEHCAAILYSELASAYQCVGEPVSALLMIESAIAADSACLRWRLQRFLVLLAAGQY